MKKMTRSIIAVLLAAVVASQSTFAYATDVTDNDVAIVSEVTEVDGSETDVTLEEQSVDVSENDYVELVDVSDNEETVSDVSENEKIVVKEVSGNDVSENDGVWYSIPDGYVLSASDLELKADLRDTVKGMEGFVEGRDLVAGEVFALVSTEEEAKLIADAYNSEIESFESGVVVLNIPDGVTVAEAVAVAADSSLNMPIVYPNFYRYATDDVSESSIESYEDGLVDNDTNIPLNIYSDPYLRGNSAMYQWQHDVIGSSYAWENGYTGSGVKVAVLDTGVKQNHSDLTVTASTVFTGESTTDDNGGHGSHCAGIIAGKANGKLGVGVAPDASIYSVKVLNSLGNGTDAGIIKGINYAVGTYQVDIISMSLGGPGYNTAFKTPLENAYTNGTVVVVSAGNDGGNLYCYPASYDHVICVAATDKNNKRAVFSNTSNKVDVSAPGVDIPSADYQNTNGYVLMSGTSMACPVIAGEVAVILSASDRVSGLKDKNGNLLTGSARVNAVEKILKNAAKGCGSGMGKGIVSLPKALGIPLDTATPTAPVVDVVLSADKQSATVSISKKIYGTIIYTVDGSNPSYKNGEVVKGNYYTGSFILDASKAKYTVKAVVINRAGKSSKVITKNVTLSPYIKSIELSGPVYAAPGKAVTPSVKILPSYASNKKLTWEASSIGDATLANVNLDKKNGKLTIKKTAVEGTEYVIKATAQDGSNKVATYKVIIKNNYVASVKFSQKTIIAPAKSTGELGTSLADLLVAKDVTGKALAASDFFWSSSNTNIITVDASGYIKVVGAGSVKITVKAKDTSGKTATITVKTSQLVTSIAISGPSKLAAGTNASLKAYIYPSNATNKGIKWTVEGVAGAKVDAKGKLTIPKTASGVAIVKAEAKDGSGITGVYKVNILTGKITGITPDVKTANIFRNSGTFGSTTSATIEFAIAGSEGFDKNCYEVSCNSALVNLTVNNTASGVSVTVNANGKGTGTAKITVRATDGSNKSVTVTVNVKEPVTAITIAPSAAGAGGYVAQGKTLALSAKTTGAGKVNTKVTWSIETKTGGSGVTVDKNGKVSASKTAAARSSTYYVTATAADGSNAKATYEVIVFTPTKSIAFRGYYPRIYKYYIYKGNAGGFYFNVEGDTYYDPETGNTYYAGLHLSVNKTNILSAMIGADTSGLYALCVGDNKGTAKVTVKTADGKSASYTMIVR